MQMSVYSLGHFFNRVLAVFLRLYHYFVKRSLSNPSFFILLCFSRAIAAIQFPIPLQRRRSILTINGSSLRNIFAFHFHLFVDERRTRVYTSSWKEACRQNRSRIRGTRASRMRASTLPVLRFLHSLASVANLRVAGRSRRVGFKRIREQKKEERKK